MTRQIPPRVTPEGDEPTEPPVDLTDLATIAFSPHRIGLDLRPEEATYRLFTDAEEWARFVLSNLRSRANTAVGRVAPPVVPADDAKSATPSAALPLAVNPEVVAQLSEGVDFDAQALIFVSPGPVPAGNGIRIEQIYWQPGDEETAPRLYVQIAFTSLTVRAKVIRTVYPNDAALIDPSGLAEQTPDIIFVDMDGYVLEKDVWLNPAADTDTTE